MAYVVDNKHLINSVSEIYRSDIVILRVTEKEIQEAFQEYKTTKFTEYHTKQDKHQGHIKRKYQKYHRDIRPYIRRYHKLKTTKHG